MKTNVREEGKDLPVQFSRTERPSGVPRRASFSCAEDTDRRRCSGDLMRNEPLLKCFIKLGTLGAMFFAVKEAQDHGLLMKDSLSQWIVERVKTIQLPFKLISPDPNCEKKFHSDEQCESSSGKTGEEMSSS
ncbi:hypothetical protein LR48_Vigan04g189600 [Vigna angularis]|uniref:Uncharacterized protein n=1 Tax=Phaseolus angularis TaxID=3914 RepID=A0A0L9UG26_PHAAN|nr:hypothetical protein LR48_Vigan04g189600 [Vigna angularis]